MRIIRRVVVGLWALSAATPLYAHDGPEHVVFALTAEMAATGPTAELHFRRAVEYRALGKRAEAATDLRAALALDADLPAARFELARLLIRSRDFAEAQTLLEPLIAGGDVDMRAAALALRAELRGAQGAAAAAVADYTAALAIRPDVGWYLARSQLQARPDEADVRVVGLREGYAATQSPVVRAALCDALVDLGAAAPEEFVMQACLSEAASIVADELSWGRFHAAWLLRRARVHRLQGDAAGATVDLQTAVAELTARLDVPRPDPSLLDERAAAWRLLGDDERAAADVAAATEVRRRLAEPPALRRSVPSQVEP